MFEAKIFKKYILAKGSEGERGRERERMRERERERETETERETERNAFKEWGGGTGTL